MDDEPYNTHLRWAKRGYIDMYHSGFPCTTFSHLKFREMENIPGPVRTKDALYGKASNNEREQRTCDEGTIKLWLRDRSIWPMKLQTESPSRPSCRLQPWRTRRSPTSNNISLHGNSQKWRNSPSGRTGEQPCSTPATTRRTGRLARDISSLRNL